MVSPGSCGELDQTKILLTFGSIKNGCSGSRWLFGWSKPVRTPGSSDPGGIDHEGEAPNGGEILLFLPAVCFWCFSRGSSYCFLLPELADITTPFGHNMATSSFNYDNLVSGEEVVFNEAWSTFFLNEVLVTAFLRSASTEVVQATLDAGSLWRGTSWNSTKAAKELRRLTGVSVVSAEFREYNNAFLFSLALVNGLEIVKLELSGPAGEAAFALAEVWTKVLQGEGPLSREEDSNRRGSRDAG